LVQVNGKSGQPGDAIRAASKLCAVRSIDYSSTHLNPLAAGLRADLECVVGMALMPGQWSDVTRTTRTTWRPSPK
jgi:hypothetical protein